MDSLSFFLKSMFFWKLKTLSFFFFYHSAACKNDSCQHGECIETINSHRCSCFKGFYGEKCEHGKKTRWCCIATHLFWCRVGELMRPPCLAVVQCSREEVTVPSKGNVNCIHRFSEFSYDSQCHYSCEEGYQLNSSTPLTCGASGEWSAQPPTCDCELGDAYFQDRHLPPVTI